MLTEKPPPEKPFRRIFAEETTKPLRKNTGAELALRARGVIKQSAYQPHCELQEDWPVQVPKL